MASTRKQTDATPHQEPLEQQEPAPDEATVADENVQMRRCHDHPVNFPDENPVRSITEFYGKGHHSYCKRCDGIRGKAHREARKTHEEQYGTDVAPFRIPLLIREVTTQIDADVPLDEAIEQTVHGLHEAVEAVRIALQQHFAPDTLSSAGAEASSSDD